MPQGTESTAKFKADISQLKSAMQEAGRQVRLANSEFKAATAGMANWAKSADGLSAKVKQLDSVLGAQKSKLASLEKQYELVAKSEGESSKGAQELAIKINNQKAAIGKTEAELDKYEKELDDCKKGTGNFDKSLEQTNKDTKKASDGFTVMKGALASLVADGIKLAINGLKNLGREAVEAYKEFDTGRDNVIKTTGATGDAAKKLTDSYSNVASSVKGSFDSIGSAVGEVSTRFGFAGKELETATEDFVKFADITGTDATTAVQLVSRAMGDAGIESKNYKELLDDLATASQASGISVDKLTEMITKYGAPMRALGMDTKDSISIFSAWEKAGVNTEIAFSGMKKAISNWGKANKDPKKEFQKTLDEIEKTPDIATATSKAIEVFGAKAGPDLADAIKGGRFEYSDFLKLLKSSKGTVENTYKTTQSGADNIELALQKVRVKLAKVVDDLVTKNKPQIEQFLKSAVDGAKNFLTSIANLFKYIIENGDTILAILKGIAVAFITFKVTSIISTVITAFKTLFVTIKAGEGVMAALNATLAINPWILAAAAVAGLVTAFIALDDSAGKTNSALSKNQKAVNNMYKEYQDLDDARNKSNKSIDNEYDYLSKLKDEYNGLIGSNGKVKKGYKDRANFIINQLAKSMGIEREEIQKLINKNGKLSKSIDDIIIKKQAEATQNANEDAYKKAIDKRDSALKKYNKALEDNKQRREILEELREREIKGYDGSILKYGEIYDTLENYNKLIDGTTDKGLKRYFEKQKEEFEDNYHGAWAAVQDVKHAYDESEKTLKKAETTYIGYQNTIKNYEGLSAAILSGDAKKIKAALTNIQTNFIDAKNGTANTLSKQVTDFESNYKNLKAAVKNGVAGVSQADVDEAKKLVNRSKTELTKWFTNTSEISKKAKSAGLTIPKEMANGIKSGEISVTEATEAIEMAIKFKNMAKNAKGATKKTINAVVDGLLSGKISVKDAGKQLETAGIKGLKTGKGDAKKAGEKKVLDYAYGIKGKTIKAEEAGKAVAKSAKKGLDTKDSSTNPTISGQNFLSGYLTGLSNRKLIGKINDQGIYIGKTAVKNLNKGQNSKSPSKATEKSGKYYGEGYLLGIKSMTKKVLAAAFNMGTGATNALAEAQEEGSPSKITYKSGVNFVKGFIGGIVSEKNVLVNTVKGLVTTVTKELLNLNNFNFSEVSSNATTAFSDSISKKISYTTDKISYMNEKKLAEFDATISKLQAKQDKKDALKTKKKNAKDKIESLKDKRKTAQSSIKELKSKKKLTKAEKTRLSKYEKSVKSYNKQINKQQGILSSTNSKLKKYNTNYNKLISQQNKAKDAYSSASSTMIDEFSTALSEYQTKAENLINDTINGITDTYQARYDELISKQDSLIDKLQEAGDLFEISNAGVLTVNDIEKQTAAIWDYANSLETIKDKVSSGLFDKLLTYDMDQGQAFMNYLLALSDEELKAYSDAFDRKMSISESLAKSLFKSDFDDVANDYKKAITEAMASLPKQLENLGQEVMQGFINGLTENTDYITGSVKTLINSMIDTFKTELDIHSPSGVTTEIGEETGSGLVNGLLNMVNSVKKATNQLIQASSQPLDGLGSSINLAKQGVNTGLGASSGTVITNNYNMVQNNTSPKSLSALDTYKARQQQLSMLKAATSNI